ncbi:Uncharacterised protein [uncultured archaeon]|nr:Uncharacterised protein [uncultured archaeon]
MPKVVPHPGADKHVDALGSVQQDAGHLDARAQLLDRKKVRDAAIAAFHKDGTIDSWKKAAELRAQVADVEGEIYRQEGNEPEARQKALWAADLRKMSLLGREKTPEEMAYANQEIQYLPVRCRQRESELPNYQYHGTRLWRLEGILEARSVSTQIDQTEGGSSSSFDPPGTISVTQNDSVKLSIEQYAGVKDRGLGKFMPPGVLLVIRPTPEQEGNRDVNIDSPDLNWQLVAVLSTPQNRGYVEGLLRKHNYPQVPMMGFHEWPPSLDKIRDWRVHP